MQRPSPHGGAAGPSLPCAQPGRARASAGGTALALHAPFSSFFTALAAISSGNGSPHQQQAFPQWDQAYFSTFQRSVGALGTAALTIARSGDSTLTRALSAVTSL